MMKRVLAICLLLAVVGLLATGCASTGSSEYPYLSVGGYSQFRYTTFHGGPR